MCNLEGRKSATRAVCAGLNGAIFLTLALELHDFVAISGIPAGSPFFSFSSSGEPPRVLPRSSSWAEPSKGVRASGIFIGIFM